MRGRPLGSLCLDGTVEGHDFIPVSFVFETQLLDESGRVVVRQPDPEAGRVYCVCMKCHGHTYIRTEWLGFYLPHPEGVD